MSGILSSLILAIVLSGNPATSVGTLDLAPLAKAQKLRTLTIDLWQGSDLTPLGGAGSLRRLAVSGSGLPRDQKVRWLRKLTRLAELELNNIGMDDISSVIGLKRLQSLSLGNNPALQDISGLDGLTELRSLTLWGTSVKEIAALAKLEKLRLLRLPCSIKSLVPLRGLASLEDLSVCQEESIDLLPLAGSRHLYRLSVRSKGEVNLTPLKSLPQLEVLDLRECSVSGWDTLFSLPRLRTIELHKVDMPSNIRKKLRTKHPDVEIKRR